MNERLDGLLMIVIAAAAAVWLIWLLNRWMTSGGASGQLPGGVPINEHIPHHPALELLEQEGFDVIGGKVKINLAFQTDNNNSLYSRLFIDYVASDQRGSLYLVKLSRDRLPLPWTGAGLRDRLLPLLMMYPECEGLLYVDLDEHAVRRVTMEWSDEEWIGNED